MDTPKIGIRQADGSFYQILDDSQPGRKKLVLSPARPDQAGVKIDLYRSVDGTLEGAESLGTLTFDGPGPEGFHDIEFEVNLDDEGQLSAQAALPGQAPQRLSVDVAALRGDSEFNIPPFPGLVSDEAEAATLDLPDLELPSFDDVPTAEVPVPDSFDLPDLDVSLPDDQFAPLSLDDDPLTADNTLAASDEFSLDEDLALGDDPSLGDDLAPGDGLSLEDDLNLEEDLGLGDGEDLKSDSELLADDALAAEGIDNLGDEFDSFDLGGLGDLEDPAPASAPEAPAAADSFESFDLDAFDSPAPSAPDAFDLGDLDAGFGSAPGPEPAAAPDAEAWEKISLDDLEPMEFLDTGDEISAPSRSAPAQAAAPAADDDLAPMDDLSFDDEAPLSLSEDLGADTDLGDLSDLSDLSDGDEFGTREAQDPAVPLWTPPAAEAPAKEPKKAKAPKAPKPAAKAPASAEGDPGFLDKTALVLSLAAIALWALFVLVLLFLNMVKPPQTPAVTPEVMNWKAPTLAQGGGRPAPASLTLTDPSAPGLEAATVLEVPSALQGAQVALRLAPGQTADQAAALYGAPAKVEGNRLSW